MTLTLVMAIAATFNLVCTGNETTGRMSSNRATDEKTSFTEVYRVDLLNNRWCSDVCRDTKAIKLVDDTHINLQSGSYAGVESFLTISRETGDYFYMFRTNSAFRTRSGSCERAPFTGFPERKF